jgi:23S rRNA (adenine2503-C2)-methyltransferase
VTLLAGVNDGEEDARALGELVRSFTARSGHRPRLSVIPFNRIEGDPFARSAREAEFRALLAAEGIGTHLRYSGGSDVDAACGQLAARA